MSAQSSGPNALELAGKRVLVRVDFNVPFGDDGQISDDTRIRAALPTLVAVLEAGGTPVLLSHRGRPKGGPDPAFGLAPVAGRLAELLGRPVEFVAGNRGAEVEARVAAAAAGSVLLLENVRFNAGETKGDAELAADYARLGDCFLNDAFGSSHRDHASVTGPARLLPSAPGLLLLAEIEAFGRVLSEPARPFAAILGGAKVSDKLSVIENLIAKVDHLLVGGGMAYTFLGAQGHAVGSSLVQEDQFEMVRACLAAAAERGVQIHLPVDHIVATEFDPQAAPEAIDAVDIPEGRMGLDIGPRSQAAYAEVVRAAGTVVWNGPMGVFEWPAFQAGTESVGRAVADCAGYTVVGGGDSVAAIELFGLGERIDHISTGGGASLELLEGKELPGIACLDARAPAERIG